MDHIFKALKNSLNGLKLAWKDDRSFRNAFWQWGIGIILATGLSVYFSLHPYIWLLLVGSLFPIIWLETINTSIEAVTDKASPERHPLAKKAKDIGSAAVLLARVFTVLCWSVVGVVHFV